MTETKVTAFRFPDELMARIDRYGVNLAAQTGIDLTRAQVVKKLIALALDHVEPEFDEKLKRMAAQHKPEQTKARQQSKK